MTTIHYQPGRRLLFVSDGSLLFVEDGDAHAAGIWESFRQGGELSDALAAVTSPWVLIDAECVKGRTLTSYENIKRDLQNAGAKWVDQEVVVDNGLITSRKPEDLPAFNHKLVEALVDGPVVRAKSPDVNGVTAPNADMIASAASGR